MIDRIDLANPDSATATVIDYKTGRPLTEGQILEGDYHRQLVFYALLLELGRPDLHPESYVLDFVGQGSDEPVVRSFAITEEQKRDLRKLIHAVWAKITALDFSPLISE